MALFVISGIASRAFWHIALQDRAGLVRNLDSWKRVICLDIPAYRVAAFLRSFSWKHMPGILAIAFQPAAHVTLLGVLAPAHQLHAVRRAHADTPGVTLLGMPVPKHQRHTAGRAREVTATVTLLGVLALMHRRYAAG
ncbi:hypothetical protein CYMTET_30878, partial [Cymbomonas tetramitiformis]